MRLHLRNWPVVDPGQVQLMCEQGCARCEHLRQHDVGTKGLHRSAQDQLAAHSQQMSHSG